MLINRPLLQVSKLYDLFDIHVLSYFQPGLSIRVGILDKSLIVL
jgi:hypothetical protein